MALFHHDIYNTERTPPSYWEATAPIPRDAYAPLEGDASCDVAIIGGGFTGLSAALHLARTGVSHPAAVPLHRSAGP